MARRLQIAAADMRDGSLWHRDQAALQTMRDAGVPVGGIVWYFPLKTLDYMIDTHPNGDKTVYWRGKIPASIPD